MAGPIEYHGETPASERCYILIDADTAVHHCEPLCVVVGLCEIFTLFLIYLTFSASVGIFVCILISPVDIFLFWGPRSSHKIRTPFKSINICTGVIVCHWISEFPRLPLIS